MNRPAIRQLANQLKEFAADVANTQVGGAGTPGSAFVVTAGAVGQASVVAYTRQAQVGGALVAIVWAGAALVAGGVCA